MLLVAIFPFDKGVFKIIPSARFLEIMLARFEDFRNLIRLGNGHCPRAAFIVRRVQGNGEI